MIYARPQRACLGQDSWLSDLRATTMPFLLQNPEKALLTFMLLGEIATQNLSVFSL
jgi:hypothetical protein